MREFTRAELIAMRIECDKSLTFFTRLFFHYLRGNKFKLNKHHQIIADGFQAVENYDHQFLNINIPPRHSKTELAINFIARGLGLNPRANYLYITASDELRAESSTRIRDIVSSELFYLLYGVRLKKDQKARNVWRTESGGGMKTATIFGQITGFGAGQMVKEFDDDGKRLFGGAIVLDDIDKIIDAEKGTANNEKTHSVIFNTILSRVNSEDTPLINIQQRAGEDDSTSVLLKHYNDSDPDRLNHINLPIVIDGQPLWADQVSIEKIESLRTSPYTAHVFETQYMQNPTSPNHKPFHKSKLKWFKRSELPQIINNSEAVLGYIDVKDEGKDFYCHIQGRLIGDLFYVTNIIHNQLNTEATVPASINMINESKADCTCVETNSMGAMVFKDIKNGTDEMVLGISNQANKITRIVNAEHLITNHFRFIEDYDLNSDYATYIDRLCKYEYKRNSVDDAPDATAGVAQLIKTRYGHLFERPED